LTFYATFHKFGWLGFAGNTVNCTSCLLFNSFIGNFLIASPEKMTKPFQAHNGFKTFYYRQLRFPVGICYYFLRVYLLLGDKVKKIKIYRQKIFQPENAY